MLLETERLIIRKMKEEDKEYRDIIVDDSNEYNYYTADEEFKQLCRKVYWLEQDKEDIYNCWIFIKDTGEFAGHICLQRIWENEPEIGIRIIEKHRNKGIGPEAVKMLCNWYCENNNISTLTLNIKKSNSHSIHMFEKLGAVRVGDKCALSERTIAYLLETLSNTDEDELREKTLFTYKVKMPIK